MKKILLTYFLLFVGLFSINAQNTNIIYESLYDNNNFTQAVDINLAAGATDGNLNVTPSGAATYSLPISIPPGTKAVMPSLSLIYSSQAGNGLLGIGWNISGLSSITRTGKNQVYDNTTSPVKLTSEDFFALDGNRLVLTSGTNGAAGSIYATKMETFSKVSAFGAISGCPQYFIVEMKDGMIYEYGNSDNSRFLTTDATKVISWQLNKVRDQYGNYVEYIYETLNRELRIKEIKYTGNTINNLLPYNKIEFTYGFRKDKNTAYVSGDVVASKSLLTKINVTTEDNKLVRKYEFAYGLKNDKSYLKRINEAGADGVFVNPTIFKYGASSVITTLDVKADFQNFNADYFSGDYNGDGFTDIVVAHRYKENGIVYHSGFSVYCAKPIANSNNIAFQLSYSQTFSSPLRIKLEIRARGYNQVVNRDVALSNEVTHDDFNGDGRSDIVLVYTGNASGGGNKIDKIEILQPNETAQNFTIVNCPLPTQSASEPEIRVPFGKFFYTGDFDGDSKTDYMLMTYYNEGGYLSFPGRGIFNKNIVSGLSGSNLPNGFELYDVVFASQSVSIIDFDGDGKSEIMVQLNNPENPAVTLKNRTEIYTFEKFSTNPSIDDGVCYIRQLHSSTALQTKYDIYTADFNGDGKIDLLTCEVDRTKTSGNGYEKNIWEIWYSTGNSFSDKIPFTFPGSGRYPVIKDDRVIPSDYNGDGMADVAYFKKTGSNNVVELYLFTNTGDNSFTTQPKFDLTYPQGIINDDILIGDFNGDGFGDIVDVERNTNLTSYNTRYLSFFSKTKERLLTGVINGMLAESAIEYDLATYSKTQTTNRIFFQNNGISNNLINYVVLPTNLVTAIVIPNGNNTGIDPKTLIEYFYQDAKLHRGGYGYLGFSKFTTYDRSNETESTVEFETLTPQYQVVVKKQTTKHYGQNQNLSEVINTNTLVQANGRYWARIDKVEQNDLLSGSFSVKEFLYDANGNVYNEKINTNNEEYTTVDRGNFIAIGNGMPVLPSYQTVSNSRNNNGTYSMYSKNTEYQYYPQGSLKQEKAYNFNNLGFVQTNYEYDTWGNVKKVTIASPNLATKTSTSVYDTKGRFELSSVNNIGQTSYKTFYPEWGAVKTATDITNLTSSFTYDGLGRPKTTVTPQGHTKTISYTAAIKGYTVTYTQPNSPKEIEYYDFLGRVTQKQIEINSLGNPYNIISFNNYDSKGLLKTKYIPFKDDGIDIPKAIRTTYDYLNRPKTIKTDGIDGETTYNYSYSQGKSTVQVINNAGQVSSKTADASGKVISSTDHGGTLTFKYDGLGNQLEVKLNGQLVSTMEYDDWGRQKSLTDANAGKTEYRYNAYGELEWQKDAKTNQYTMKYDALGRNYERTGPEGITLTEFVISGNGINQVKKITSFNGITEEYEYDTWHRVSKTTETIEGIAYPVNYAYNAYNQVATTTYPSGLVITNSYNTQGMLTKVVSGTQMLFDATAATAKRNAFGNWTQYQRGDGKTNIAEYNQYGTPTRFYAAGVQDLNMSWDLKTGNLTYRQDAIRNLKEDFLYDNLNRLKQAQVVGLQPYVFTFEDNGNIKSKTDAGVDYFYDAAKFNAVKYVKGYTSAIPSMQQDISYAAFLRPLKITEGVNELEYTYASDYERRKGVLKKNNIVENTRLYLGDFEINTDKNGVKTFVHYISGGEAIVVKRDNAAFEYYFPYTDHLGSIVAVTNTSGAIVAEQNFDVWGRKRNVITWDYANVQDVPYWLYRGYTGHEHLTEFGLINMNARLYDPVLGRMLSPDNFAHEGTQGLNKYSYANNNPLIYTDPSGNIPFLAIPLIYGAVNLAADAIQGNVNSFGSGVKSFAMGAVQGVLAGVGSPGLAAWKYAANAVLSHMPGINIGGNGFSLSISPSLSFGSDIFSFGANISAGINVGGVFLGASIGGGYSTNNYDILGSKISGFESRASFMAGIDNPDFSFILGTNDYSSGSSSQKTGFISFNIGGFHLSYENDGAPFGKFGLVNTDSKGEVTSDGYRTAAISLGWGDFSIETRMFTGFRDLNSVDNSPLNGAAPYGWVGNSEIDDYRFGSLTFGYKGYKMGINADWVRHGIQNKFAHGFLTHQAWIPRIALSRASYEFKTPASIPFVVNKTANLFTHW